MGRKKQPGEIIRYRLPSEQLEKIRAIAAEQCCSMAAVMRQAITEWLRSKEK